MDPMKPLRESLARALHGDPEAFGEVVDHYQAMAFGCAYAVLRNRHDAEDAVQDAFIAAYTRLADLRDADRFPGWLRRIVLSACTRITRRRKLPSVPMAAAEDVPSPDGDPVAHAEKAEAHAEVMQALAMLPPAYRMAATLYYVDGYSVDEVAEFLEVPSGTVKYRLHEARKRLRERMVAAMKDDLAGTRPGPELRQSIIDTLMARKARFDESVSAYYATEATPEPDHEWARSWHDRRLEDVRANAAQYGITPDDSLPRMLPEYHRQHTFRDDFRDVPQRWGVPEGTRLIGLRDLARDVGATPLAIHRWEAQGLPVLRYDPWEAYDEERAKAWVQARGIRPEERMTAEGGREPLLLVLRAVAAGEASETEALPIYRALAAPAWLPDPLWQAEWQARRAAEREENARAYGLAEPTSWWAGIPEGTAAFETRDICRRLGLSPFDMIRWTREGMPAVRESPYIRWDPQQVACWLADRDQLPQREYSKQELDDLARFVIGAVARGEEPPEDARDVFTSWVGVM